MSNRIIIIGAGGHGRVVADIARLNGYGDIIFLDDAPMPYVAGPVSDFQKYLSGDFFIAIGNNTIRKTIQAQLRESGANIVSLLHPNSVVASDVHMGHGCVIMAGAVINPGALLGDGVIVNTCASIDHDCSISDFAHISVGAHIAGTVTVGDCTMIGAGATVINNITICSNCMIGAGAVVVKDILAPGTYVGIPAKYQANA